MHCGRGWKVLVEANNQTTLRNRRLLRSRRTSSVRHTRNRTIPTGLQRHWQRSTLDDENGSNGKAGILKPNHLHPRNTRRETFNPPPLPPSLHASNKVVPHSLVVLIVLSSAYSIVLFITNMAQCAPNPPSALWRDRAGCGFNIAGVAAMGYLNAFVDLTILILPIRMVWTLQMSTKQKVAIAAVFGLGFMYASSLNPRDSPY